MSAAFRKRRCLAPGGVFHQAGNASDLRSRRCSLSRPRADRRPPSDDARGCPPPSGRGAAWRRAVSSTRRETPPISEAEGAACLGREQTDDLHLTTLEDVRRLQEEALLGAGRCLPPGGKRLRSPKPKVQPVSAASRPTTSI